MAFNKKRRPNATGRNDQFGQYIKLSYDTIRSAAFRNLSGAALKVWCEMRTRFHGTNNGQIGFSLKHGAKTLGLGKATVKRALDELKAKGFIVLTKQGRWYGRQASLWRLTDISVDGAAATRDWKNWQPVPKTKVGSKLGPSASATVSFQNSG
jgi:hypothetical protein